MAALQQLSTPSLGASEESCLRSAYPSLNVSAASGTLRFKYTFLILTLKRCLISAVRLTVTALHYSMIDSSCCGHVLLFGLHVLERGWTFQARGGPPPEIVCRKPCKMWLSDLTSTLHLERIRYTLGDKLSYFDKVWSPLVGYLASAP